MKLKLDCQDVSRLLSDAQDNELPAAERARLRLHLVICQTCRNVDEQMQFIRQAMKRLGDEETRPPP
jgi:predicted anti-sigma-YlaC factor YlaD